MTTEHTQGYWASESSLFKEIVELGMQRYVQDRVDMSQAFALTDRSIRCIDEGTPGGLHLAGSGILMSPDAFRAFCERAKPDGAYSHAECGACGLYAKEHGVHLDHPDRCGTEWVSKVATDHGVPDKGTIAIGDMHRPSGFHTARIAYYDGTGVFDWSPASGLPKGFIISRAYLDPDYAKKEVAIACAIAHGDHGFGALFTAEEPFYLIAIADTEEMLQILKAELEEVASAYHGTVRVDGFLSAKNVV